MELDESTPPVKDDRKQLEDRDATCGMLCGSSVAVSEGTDDLDSVDGPMYHRVKKTIHWVSVMDGLQRVLIFADDENLSYLPRTVRVGFGSNVTYFTFVFIEMFPQMARCLTSQLRYKVKQSYVTEYLEIKDSSPR